MKKFLMIAGAFFCVLLLVFIGIFLVTAIKGKDLDQSSKKYVDEAVPAICQNWSEEELIKRESSELGKTASQADLDKFFTIYKKLGVMKKYLQSTGESQANYDLVKGNTITANYRADVVFDTGTRTILINLIRENNEWKILGFRVHFQNIDDLSNKLK